MKALFVSSISFVSCHTASLTIKDAWESFIPRNSIIYTKAQHPAKIPNCLHKHLKCIHFTVRATKLPSIMISRRPGGRGSPLHYIRLIRFNNTGRWLKLNPFLWFLVRDFALYLKPKFFTISCMPWVTSGLQWNTYGVFHFVVCLLMRWNLSPIWGAFTIFSGS